MSKRIIPVPIGTFSNYHRPYIILIHDAGREELVYHDEIRYAQSDEKTVTFHVIDVNEPQKERLIVTGMNIGEYSGLYDFTFAPTHQSYFINLIYFSCFNIDGTVRLRHARKDETILVSTRKASALRKRLGLMPPDDTKEVIA